MKKELPGIEEWDEFDNDAEKFVVIDEIDDPTDEEIEAVIDDEDEDADIGFLKVAGVEEEDDDDDDGTSDSYHHHWSRSSSVMNEDIPWDEALFSGNEDEDWSWRP